MRKTILVFAMLIAASLFTLACAPAANNSAANSSAANKPANAAPANASGGANSAAIETDIMKAISDMAAASEKGDAAYFEKLYTDNYMFIGPDGTTATGNERIAALKAGDTKYDSISYADVSVRSNAEGNGAVSISLATVKGKNMGKAVDGKFRVMHVWSKAADGWHLASGTATPITGASASDKSPGNSNTAPSANNNSNGAK